MTDDLDAAIRLEAFDHVKRLIETHDRLTAIDLLPVSIKKDGQTLEALKALDSRSGHPFPSLP